MTSTLQPPRSLTPGPKPDSVSFAWLLAIILKGRRTIIIATGVGILLAVISGVMKRPSFTSEFSFIPASNQDASRGGLASLAGQFGINVGSLGGSEPPQLYADLLTTREILSSLAHDTVTTAAGARIPLQQFLNVHDPDTATAIEETVLVLRQNVIATSVAARTTGAVTVRATTGSRQASYEIAKRLLQELNQFNSVTRQSQASAERKFAEGRLENARRSLHAVEDTLQRFLQGNRQFGEASQLRFERERLESEVSLQRDVVRGLAQQAEEAAIREVRDTPVITMIERPRVPAIRDPMGRIRTLVVLAMGGFFVGLAIVLAKAGWQRYRAEEGDDPSFGMLMTEWRRLTRMFRRG